MDISNKKIIAIIGPTASGKSDLALEMARKYGGEILSIDSLAVYEDFDIFSNKPTLSERAEIVHYGISVLKPNRHANAQLFLDILRYQILEYGRKKDEPLFIVGGSSFYLKSIIDGLSVMPELSIEQKAAIDSKIATLQSPFEMLQSVDPDTKVKPSDTFRVRKALELYFATGLTQSEYFAKHPRIPFEGKIEIFNINLPRDILRERIARRTECMLERGAVDEVEEIYKNYPDFKSYQCAKAIGVREAIRFIDGEISLSHMRDLIVRNTITLAKRQATFNKTQFRSSMDAKLLNTVRL